MNEQKLSELSPGMAGKVTRVEGNPADRQRLQEMGLVRGTTVLYVRAAPLGDPLEVKVRGYSLSLRRSEAEGVTVEVGE